MLESISIKNIALIDEAQVEFGKGLNVLTGETGAGKSMIIDSLNFALGEKAHKDMIRTGTETARVEAVFSINEEKAVLEAEKAGLEIDEEGLLIINRSLTRGGKPVSRINGQAATAAMLRRVAEILIDIHGQHEHQWLLNPSKHIELVDGFCGEAIASAQDELGEEYRHYRSLKKKAEEMAVRIEDKDARLDFIRFQIQELEAAHLEIGEEERLEEEKNIAAASEKLEKAVSTALYALYDGSETGNAVPAVDNVHRALAAIEGGSGDDKRLVPIAQRLSEAVAELEDVVRDIRRYGDRIDSDPVRLNQIQERLSEIYRMKKKYGGSVETALAFLDKTSQERDFLEDSSYEMDQLEQAVRQKEKQVEEICCRLSKIRKGYAERMAKGIEAALWELGMENARFNVVFDRMPLSASGFDKAEMMLSANKGEALKPLATIASGGEMSRVMLAIKSVAANADAVETYIFDEIDTGVSGRTAQKVAEKMAGIAEKRQILCITHLPQIAAMADRHILIEKLETEGNTVTRTHVLDEKAVIEELSRLLGGARITEQTRAAAAEMREMGKGERRKEKREKIKEKG